jgi:predicted nucleic acid-binding Zn ribbon protein
LEALWFQQQFKQKETQLEYERQISEMSHRKQKILLVFISLVLVLVVLIMVLMLNRKKMLLKNKDIQLQNEALMKDAMAKELGLRNREMTAKMLVQVQRQEWVTEMIQKLKAAADDKKALSEHVREIIRNLEQYKNVSNPDDFDYYFTKTNPDFYDHLRADFPDLTSNELRLCAYLKMNLNTKDIAAICNITPESARVARSRLRKSLNLVDSNVDLASFLSKY